MTEKDVFRELLATAASIQREVDRLFRELWSKVPGEYSLGVNEPPADVEDRGDEYVVYVDVPGFSKDEIKIRVTEDMVEVRAEKSVEKKAEIRSRNYVLRERLYEGFAKKITLPTKIKPDQAKAVLNNGVLEIHLPKSGATREIEISVG